MKVCGNCFNDLEIKKFVETSSKEVGICDFCENHKTHILDINELLDFFTEFLEIFITDEELGSSILETIHQDWHIFNQNCNSEKLLNRILELVDSEIASSQTLVCYIEEINDSVEYWDVLKEDIKWRRRFLADADTLSNLGWDAFFQPSTGLSDEKVLFRARIHSKENSNTYDLDKMGCPPKENTTNGRANPDGIPYLYLSEKYETTLYETRVTYLDEVSIGSFKLANDQEILLVDFTEFSSPFLDMGNIIDNAKSRLLKEKISFDLSKPIRRYDSPMEYLPTQFICEFIRYYCGADGIVFDSSLHKGGINYVIFSYEKFKCVKVDKYHISSINIEGTLEADFLPQFDD